MDNRITTCVIAGGGPAGLMAGFLLARAGVEVIVLEKHKDFLRDFRGDTIHPSTIQVMDELGLADDFLALPHNKVRKLSMMFGETAMPLVDFSRTGAKFPYIAFMPQWDFLNFLAEKARAFPTFTLLMETEATALIEEGGRVTGITAQGPDGAFEIRADLVISADGRDSHLRAQSGLNVMDLGAPMDVLWFNLPKPADAPPEPLGHILPGKILILIDRGTYWQAGYVVPKGAAAELKAQPFDAFREALGKAVPIVAEPLKQVGGWEDLKLLNVQVNRLETWWCEGLLCIGDAAHAMSPVGGVGINLAIQDAVAVGNMLAAPLRSGLLSTDVLEAFQARRERPARQTQNLQILVQNRILSKALAAKDTVSPPALFYLFKWIPPLRAIPAHYIGVGFLPEHVDQ